MKRPFLFFLLVLSTTLAEAQTYATTDDGKRVILHEDGSWELVNSNDDISEPSTTYIYMGTDKLKAGIPEVVHEESFGPTTSIQVAEKDNKKMIIFWQEQTDDFHNRLWTGTVILFLENGETIKLIDRNIKGQNTIKDGYEDKGGYGLNSYTLKRDLYQRYSAYFLTESECNQLKNTKISAISYQTTDPFENGRQNIKITKNGGTCKNQLIALKQ